MISEAPSRQRFSPLAVVVALSIIALLAEIGYQSTAAVAMPFLLKKHLALGMGVVGLVTMAFLLAETITKIPFGMLGDRYGRRWLVGGGPLLSGVAALAIAAALPPVWGIACIRALDGIGGAMLWPALFTTVADVVEERYRATAMSLFNIMYVGGLVGGPYLYSVVTARTNSYTAIFYVVALLFVVCALIGVSVTPGKRALMRAAAKEPAHCAEAPSLAAWGIVRSTPILRTMLVLALMMFMGFHLLNGVLAIYLNEHIGIDPKQFGQLFVWIGIIAGTLALPLGRVVDRMGKPESVRLGLAICALGMWMLPWVKSVPLLVVVAGVFALGLLLATPAWMALMTEVAGEECRGGVVAIMNTSQGLGAAVGAAVGGRLYEYSPRLPFFLSAILFSLTVGVAFRYVRPSQGRAEAAGV